MPTTFGYAGEIRAFDRVFVIGQGEYGQEFVLDMFAMPEDIDTVPNCLWRERMTIVLLLSPRPWDYAGIFPVTPAPTAALRLALNPATLTLAGAASKRYDLRIRRRLCPET